MDLDSPITIPITNDQKVDLIKDLCDTVRSKQQLDQSLNEHKMKQQLKSLNKYNYSKQLQRSPFNNNQFNDNEQDMNYNNNNQRDYQVNNEDNRVNSNRNKGGSLEPKKVIKKIAKNKKMYHQKLKQFDDFMKQREIQQQKENERIAQELQKIQKEKEEHEKIMQDLLNSSLTERNAWFHKFSKSNLTQRKQRILNIHQENKKIVKRLLEIKPHPDMILLAKSTQPFELDQNANNSQIIKTQRDYIKENKLESGQDTISKLSNLTPSCIPREKSSLSFAKEQLGVIEENQPVNLKNQSYEHNLTQRSFYKRENTTVPNTGDLFYMDQSSRPTTTTTASANLYQRPQSSLIQFQNRRVSEFKLPPHIQQNGTQHQINQDQASQMLTQNINKRQSNLMGSQTQRNVVTQNSINLDLKTQSIIQQQIPLLISKSQHSISTLLPQSIQNLNQQRKSMQRFKQLLDATQQQVPKQVSAFAYTQRSKFIDSQVWIDPEGYANNKNERMERRKSEITIQKLQKDKPRKFVKNPQYYNKAINKTSQVKSSEVIE